MTPAARRQLVTSAGLAPHSTVLVTGAAGFIGSHLSERLADAGHEVVGVDCFTDYYARPLKEANLARLRDMPNFRLLELDLSEDHLVGLLEGVDTVFHLAAQAGVRGSFGEGFEVYLRHNLCATQRLLEAAITHPLRAFVYSSSSSVYGNPSHFPMTEQTPLRPVSPYGMTKLATEELAATYHRCFGLPVVGLRYFTAYGPRQRPDMAFTRFMRAILDNEPLTILGDGTQVRDFTYVGDIVDGTIAAAQHGRFGAVYNIGGGRSVQLLTAIDTIERIAGRRGRIEIAPPQRGDAYRTGCDCDLALRELGYAPQTALEDGLAAQLEWVVRSPQPDVLAESA
ncbi:MAG TPA: NAD-dependent epimerase/dehydratase family protein [Solirubrobacteraceae bacterium]|nr:NAD-dependent epimerase/dehydratase family protein [Solirubrobacteraceae bacterium]